MSRSVERYGFVATAEAVAAALHRERQGAPRHFARDWEIAEWLHTVETPTISKSLLPLRSSHPNFVRDH